MLEKLSKASRVILRVTPFQTSDGKDRAWITMLPGKKLVEVEGKKVYHREIGGLLGFESEPDQFTEGDSIVSSATIVASRKVTSTDPDTGEIKETVFHDVNLG